MAAPDLQLGHWPDRYRQLLASAGLDRDTELRAALHPGDDQPPALFSLAQCLQQPELLSQQVRADYPDARTSRAITARLSVLQQDLALNVIAPLTLRLFLYGQAPLAAPQRIFLTARRCADEASSRWLFASESVAVSVCDYVRGMDVLANDWYPVFRQSLGISPGAYWSSMGLGLGAPFSVVWNRVEPATLCQMAQSWLKQFECDANRFIDWIPTEFSQQPCAIPQRKGCCLRYLLPGGGYCGTCGIYRKERFAAAFPICGSTSER